jgi:phosphomannomutase
VTTNENSAHALFERIKRKAPEYLDLLTAVTDEEFETAFDALLDKAVRQLEKNKDNFEKLNEVGLSGALAMALSIPGLTVVQEAHSNGHVDLTIEADHCTPSRTKLGEAKIYAGLAYHLKGLEQLLGRYTTGRDGRALLISYVRKKDIKKLIDELREDMDETLPQGQSGATQDHTLKWSFVTVHKHSSGESLQVGHIGCNLHTDAK